MKKTMILSICLLPLLVTGCGVAKLENGQEVVAKVGEETITADDLYSEIKDQFGRNALIDMIDRIILNDLYENDDEMTETINNQIRYYKEQLGDNYLSYLKSQLGLNNENEFRDLLALEYKRNKAVKDYVKSTLTDKDIEEYYENETVGDIRASHILIKPDVTDEMTDEEIEAKEAEAESLASELIAKLNNGEKFEDLAKEYSEDGSAANGGDLNWFNKGKMTEVFEKAAYDLKKGEYTKEPVKTEFGYHIILKTDEKAKSTLEQAKDGIIDALVNEKLAEPDNVLGYKALQELRKEQKLDIQDSELKKQYDSYMKELLNQ